MAAGAIPLDKAYLTAIWLETLFYGINVVLFFSYLFVTRYKRKTPRIAKSLLFTAVFMFLFSTIHVALGFQRLLDGFIYLRDRDGGPGAFFGDVSIPANVAKVIIHSINSILGDGIVVWRCYHVWGQSWKICVLPCLLIMASAACGLGQGVAFAQARTAKSAFDYNVRRWNTPLFSLSFVTNVVVTILVAARIWHLGRQLHTPHTAYRYKRALALVVESGSVYSVAVLIELVLYLANSNAFYIVYDPIAQLTAIAPTMIIVMSCLGLTSKDVDQAEQQNTALPADTASLAFTTLDARMTESMTK